MVAVSIGERQMERAVIVRNLLGAWINKQFPNIMPLLADNVIYIVGDGAAKSICHTAGIFVGKDKVKLWYDSHVVAAAVHGGIHTRCATSTNRDVITYEDERQATVTALGFVGSDVEGELPCMWMSVWHFNGEQVDFMMLTADAVDGLESAEAARRRAFVHHQSEEFAKCQKAIEGLTGRSPKGAK
jgi:hypothetical protein